MGLASMNRYLGLCLTVSTALSLSGCGFRPLYATESTPAGIAVYFEQIYVSDIGGRTGRVLRNQLMDAFTPGGTPKSAAYHLEIELNDGKEGLAIQENADITRYNYTLTAKFKLIDASNGQVMNTGVSRAIAGYNAVNEQFSTQIAQRDAEERAARELGEDIRLRLGVFFEKRFGLTNPA
jgi:LPS-assembly lipoprotein